MCITTGGISAEDPGVKAAGADTEVAGISVGHYFTFLVPEFWC